MQIPFAIELTSEAPRKKYLTPDIGQAPSPRQGSRSKTYLTSWCLVAVKRFDDLG